jgi:N-formylmaleamate deformylase
VWSGQEAGVVKREHYPNRRSIIPTTQRNPMLPPWTENDTSIHGVRLHYHRTGLPDRPPLLLVHGFSDNGLCWTPVARGLEAKYDVVMPDMRGHGLSERVSPGDNVDMAADLAELIRTLGLRRPVVVGHSMGAMVTYQIGVRFPELARALVLEDPPWWMSLPDPAPSPGQAAEHPVVKWAKDLPNQTLEELLVQNRAEHPSWSEEFLRLMCESKKQLDPAIVDVMAGRMHAPETNWLTTLPDVRHPMLIFAGDSKLGGIVTPEVVARIRTLNPKVTIAIVPDVGHLIRFDRYPAFMEALRSFLNRVAS